MISTRIKDILIEQNKTCYWLAKQCNMSHNNMGKIVNGETSTIRFETLEKICKALNCTPNEIFTSDDPTLKKLFLYQNKIIKLSINNKSDTE